MELEYTDKDTIQRKYETVVNGYFSGISKDLGFRREQLRNLYYAIQDNEEALADALHKDLNRSPDETEILELNQVLTEASLAISKLSKWAEPEKQHLFFKDMRYAASSVKLEKNPYGAVLIMGPWNYPYKCSLIPIISAIAAGNTVLFKPSELAVHSSALLSQLLENVLEETIFQSVLGGITETTQLLTYKWDKIMLTGSTKVGKIVSRAASKHLTPVTLELGGKCPVIVTKNVNLSVVAKRVAWGKLVNAGQTCICPDYAIVEHEVVDEFMFRLEEAIKNLYPALEAGNESKDYANIVSERNFDRIQGLVKNTKGTAWQLGEPDREKLFYPPTLVRGVTVHDSLMTEELFAPILPIMEVENVLDTAPALISQFHDGPLAAYLLTDDKHEQNYLSTRIRAGEIASNDVLVQGGSASIPFGGFGSSGTGHYHGKFGFDEFSYTRPVLKQTKFAELLLKARYPPYIPFHRSLIRFFSRPVGKTFPREGPVSGDFDGLTFTQLFYVYIIGIAIGTYQAIKYTFYG